MSAPKKPYILVVENINRQSGHSGVRSIEEFPSSADPKIKKIRDNPKLRILLEGADKELSEDLVCLTPEICHLSAAIEDIFGDHNEVCFEYISIRLWEALIDILLDRKRRRLHHLSPAASFWDVYVEHQQRNKKEILFERIIFTVSMNINGDVGVLHRVIPFISSELMELAIETEIERDWR